MLYVYDIYNLAKENAKEQLDLQKETLKKDDDERINALNELKNLLGLEKLTRMESFDNSHLFGTFYVGGMVVFDDFLPNKDLYRKYKIYHKFFVVYACPPKGKAYDNKT